MTTATDIANQALQLVGDNQPAITGNYPNFDDSTAGVAARNLYGPTVATVGRQFAWDFARTTEDLVLSGNPAPFPWDYEYLYPANCIQLWQIAPATLADPNNPLPTTWSVANNLVAGTQTKVVQTNVANAQAIFNNNPAPSTWDPGFREAVVNLLARCFALALAGRPDMAESLLSAAGTFTGIAIKRTD